MGKPKKRRRKSPTSTEPDASDLRRPQGPRSGINAIWGKWPGDETDEQIDEALAAAEERDP